MDLLDSDYVRSLIAEVDSSQNRDRRKREIKAFEVYSGSLYDHVLNRIKQIYPKTYSSFSISDLNLSRKIIDKLSKAYKESPVRELGNDLESEEYAQLMKDVSCAYAWQTFDIYYNLHRYAALWFSYVDTGEDQPQIVLRPLAPFQFSRVVDDIGNTKVFIVNMPSDDLYESYDTDGLKSHIQDSHQDSSCERFAIWTDTQHVVVRYYRGKGDNEACRIEYEEIEGNEDFVNPLGVIPAVFAQQGDNAALPITNPLTNQVIEFNQQYSVMLTGASLQTFGHLILKHPENQKMPDELYNSLFTYSRLPQREGEAPTELEYLTPSPNLDSQLQVLSNYGHQIITEHLGDGSQNVQGSDNFTSGLDRMIAQSDISNKIESNQQIYAKCENDLYLIIKAFYESMNDTKFKSENLSIKYSKAKPIQSEKEILESIDKKLSLGLIEKWEALVMLNPNMTESDAKDKIEAVKAEKQEAMNTLFPQVNNADQEE